MRSEKFITLKSVKTKLGNEIELITDKCFSPFTTHCSLVIGVFHGDEPQGKFLIEEYLKNFNSPSKSKISVPLQEGDMTQLSRNLRNNMTKQEIILWQYLKQRQIFGIKFRRQAVIGNYICDFVSFEKKIIIELDGGQHNFGEQKHKDLLRDKFLKSQGFKILRFWNTDIDNNISGVIDKIKCSVNSCPPLVGGPKSLISRRGVLFIPCLNPDGMALGTRTNANGVDLNRNFPTKNWGEDGSLAGSFQFNPSPQSSTSTPTLPLGEGSATIATSTIQPFNSTPSCSSPSPSRGEGADSCAPTLHSSNSPHPPRPEREHTLQPSVSSPYFGGEFAGSEIETQFVMEVIDEYKPEKILTLHAPYKVVNYDGPARDWANEVSEIIGYPVEESIGYPTPGSFGTYAGVERNIPVITLELDEEIPTEQLIPPVFEIFDKL